MGPMYNVKLQTSHRFTLLEKVYEFSIFKDGKIKKNGNVTKVNYCGLKSLYYDEKIQIIINYILTSGCSFIKITSGDDVS